MVIVFVFEICQRVCCYLVLLLLKIFITFHNFFVAKQLLRPTAYDFCKLALSTG